MIVVDFPDCLRESVFFFVNILFAWLLESNTCHYLSKELKKKLSLTELFD